MENGNQTFVTRLTRRMREASITETELARRLQIRSSLVRRWKCGNAYPQGIMMRRLADALQVKESYLNCGEPEKKTPGQIALENRALNAEKLLFEGKSINDVAAECGYKSSTAMFISISFFSEACPYTDDEQGAFRKIFSDRLEAMGLTQNQFAWSVGLSKSTISNWAIGNKMPPRCLIPLIARTLGLTGREVLGGPPLPCDREKTVVAQHEKEQSSVIKEESLMPKDQSPTPKKTAVIKSPESAGEGWMKDGTLEIRARYAAEGRGKHAEFQYDGNTFCVKFTTPLDCMSPETLSDIGDELQRAAVVMIK